LCSGCVQVVSGLKRGDALLVIYLLRPECSLISCILPGINGHNGVLLEVEWDEICRKTEYGKIVAVYRKTDVLDLQAFLLEKLNLCVVNGRYLEEV